MGPHGYICGHRHGWSGRGQRASLPGCGSPSGPLARAEHRGSQPTTILQGLLKRPWERMLSARFREHGVVRRTRLIQTHGARWEGLTSLSQLSGWQDGLELHGMTAEVNALLSHTLRGVLTVLPKNVSNSVVALEALKMDFASGHQRPRAVCSSMQRRGQPRALGMPQARSRHGLCPCLGRTTQK